MALVAYEEREWYEEIIPVKTPPEIIAIVYQLIKTCKEKGLLCKRCGKFMLMENNRRIGEFKGVCGRCISQLLEEPNLMREIFYIGMPINLITQRLEEEARQREYREGMI